jgi:hypothetical protein
VISLIIPKIVENYRVTSIVSGNKRNIVFFWEKYPFSKEMTWNSRISF